MHKIASMKSADMPMETDGKYDGPEHDEDDLDEHEDEP